MSYPTSLKSRKAHSCLRLLSTDGHRHGRKISLRGFWSAGRRIDGRRVPVAKRKFSLTITAQPRPIKLSAVVCAVSAHAVLNPLRTSAFGEPTADESDSTPSMPALCSDARRFWRSQVPGLPLLVIFD